MKSWVKQHSVRRLGLVAALTAGAVAGGVSVASASTAHVARHAHTDAGPPGGGPGAGGTVSALSADSITVSTPSGSTVSFALTNATVVDDGWTTGALSDLAVGERVMIVPTASGATTAATVFIQLPTVMGKVISVTASTIVVEDQQGFYRSIDVTDATTYLKGTTTASSSDVTVGAYLAAQGTVASDHTSLEATQIQLSRPSGPSGSGPDGGPFGGPGDGPAPNGPWGV